MVNDRLEIYADRSRWLRVADRDKRELYVSLGCALENLLIAIEHHGLGHEVAIPVEAEEGEPAAVVRLTEPGFRLPARQNLFPAISARFTDRGAYRDRSLDPQTLERLRQVVVEPSISVVLTADRAIREEVEAIVTRANNLQFADPAWRRELGTWVGKGLLGTSFLVSKVSQLAVTYLDLSGRTTREDVNRLETAPVVGVIRSGSASTRERIQAGQVLERIWLRATADGLRLHPMNQALQIPETKRELEALFELGSDSAQIVFRLGYGTAAATETPRRPVEDVLRTPA